MTQADQLRSYKGTNTIISEETSKRITSLRFLLSVLVVFIHNNFRTWKVLEDIINGNLNSSFIFNPNEFSKWIQIIISDSLASCAVPLFFIFSAYLQFKKADSFKILLKKKFKSLVIPYFLWIILNVLLVSSSKLLIANFLPNLLNNPEKIPLLNWDLPHWFSAFFGDYFKIGMAPNMHPYVGQLWFVRDLFILMCFSPLLKYCIKKFPLESFLLVTFFYFCSVRPFFVQSHALFFYVLGIYWANDSFDLFEVADKCKYKVLIPLFIMFSVVTYFGENVLFQNQSLIICNKFIVICSVLLFAKFSLILIKKANIFSVAKYLSTFSFLIYAMHMPFILKSLQTVWIKVFPMKNAFFCLFEYFGVTILDIGICLGFGILLKKICPTFFTILNGGRQ